MKRSSWKFNLGLLLILISAILFWIHYLIFHDRHNLFFYPLMDIAFIPIQVLLVTIVIDQILSNREKNALLKKLNMVIGAFFSEVGNELLRSFLRFDRGPAGTTRVPLVNKEWTGKTFDRSIATLKTAAYAIDSRRGDLKGLKDFLLARRGFLLGLLENPNLLEHERFTELLWAVFHLTEELAHRPTTDGLPETDYAHLAGDIKRAYGLLIVEWLVYMKHLKDDYPYLFSLALRTNPFNPEASVIVRQG